MNETIETLVRILDEERNGRITQERDLGSLTYNLESTHRQFQAELEENKELRAQIRGTDATIRLKEQEIEELKRNTNQHLKLFQSTEMMIDTIERLAFLAIDDRIVPNLREELGVSFNWIAVIKAVRNEFGLNLKAAKDLVDSFRAKKDGFCPTCSQGSGHSLFGHDPVNGCPVKFCTCQEW